MSDIDMARAKAMMSSVKYLQAIGLIKEGRMSRLEGIASYIYMSCIAIPLKTVIVAERPYSTDIHPTVSSAMSYDIRKSGPTPSTLGVSMDVHNVTGHDADDIEEWFRSSWKYLQYGVVCVNCTVTHRYTSSQSLSDVVPFQRWLRTLLKLSLDNTDADIQVICMGTPATDAVTKTMRSIGSGRRRIKKLEYPNPGTISYRGEGDRLSRGGTFEKTGTSRAIRDLVVRTRLRATLTSQTHPDIIMSNQIAMTGDLVSKLNVFANEVEDAFGDGTVEDTHPSLAKSARELAKAINMYTAGVLQDYVASTIANGSNISNKVSKATDWGNKREWVKGASTMGTSTKMTEVTVADQGVPQRVIQDDPDDETESAVPPVPTIEAPKKKKTRVVKRVVKRPKKRDEGSQQDTPLTNDEVSMLRTIRYYITDAYPNDSSGLVSKIDSSIEGVMPVPKEARDVLMVAAKDRADLNAEPDQTLGIDSDSVMDKAFLPKVIQKMVVE